VTNDDEAAPGWDSIERAFAEVYPEQPLHVAPPVEQQPPFAGGVLNGISIYRGVNHWHFVTFGLTDLFGKTPDDGPQSGWGYELTLTTRADQAEPQQWAIALLMGIARTTVLNGEGYAPGVRLGTGPIPSAESPLVAVAFLEDPLVQPDAFPLGEFTFLRVIGITQSEREQMQRTNTEAVLARLGATDGLLLTDPTRPSL
jgi:suppressor of fused